MAMELGQPGLKTLYLMQILTERTDEDHALNAAEIADILEHVYQVEITRQTLYTEIKKLTDFGMDIVMKTDDKRRGYYLASRRFELPELKLLVDAVQSSKFITEKKSLELIGKLEKLISTGDAHKLHRQVWVRGRIKTMNESIYYNVDAVHTAIDGDSAVSFRYYEWNRERRRVFRHDGRRYTASPWALMWDDENYYMVAFDHEAGILKHFRVDKLSDIRVLETPRQGAEAFEQLDMAAYADSHFGMFSGEVQSVRLLFENALAGPVIDRFGADISLVPYDEGHFNVTVSAAVNVQFFGWLGGFGDRVRILSPESAVEGMRGHVAALAALYGLTPEK